MAKLSLETCVSRMMEELGYGWDLADKGKFFLLRVTLGEKRMVEVSLNEKNFAKRISVLPGMLKKIESLLETMPFPVNISNF